MFSTVVTGPGLYQTPVPVMPYTSGAIYYDSNNKSFKLIDGNGNQHNVPMNNVCIQLDQASMNAITWARIQMDKEQKINDLLAKHPGLKDVKEKYDIMLALVQKEPA